MTVILDIPDEIASELAVAGQDLSRAALEALALEGYRRGALTQLHVGHLDAGNSEHYEPGELRREAQALANLDKAC
jgi:hypothetical protein